MRACSRSCNPFRPCRTQSLRDVEGQRDVDTSLKPADLTAEPIRSRAALVPATSGAKPPLIAEASRKSPLLQNGLEGGRPPRPSATPPEAGGTDGRNHELLNVDAGVACAPPFRIFIIRDRKDIARSGRPGSGTTEAPRNRQRPWRPPTRHRGWRSHPAGTCPECRRGRAMPDRPTSDRRPSPITAGRSHPERPRRPSGHPCRRNGIRRLAARPLRAHPSMRPTAPPHARWFRRSRPPDLNRRIAAGIEDLAGRKLLDDGHWCLLTSVDLLVS